MHGENLKLRKDILRFYQFLLNKKHLIKITRECFCFQYLLFRPVQ